MHAIYDAGIDRENPLSVLEIGNLEPVETPDDWVDVEVKAMSLNHHDVWALKGQALREEQVPMILGTDAAGIGPDGFHGSGEAWYSTGERAGAVREARRRARRACGGGATHSSVARGPVHSRQADTRRGGDDPRGLR